MSIIRSNGHTVKRRKLSHGEDETQRPVKPTSNGAEPDSEVSDSGDLQDKATSLPKASKSNKRTSSMLAAGSTTKSALMQFQVTELLQEIRPNYDYHLKSTKALRDQIIQTIKSIPEREPLMLHDAEAALRKTHGIAIPFNKFRPGSDVKYKFEYRTPESVSARGNLIHRLSTKDELSLEIAVQMPSALFQEKDYLNYRALHKRAYYLACIAAGVKESIGEDYETMYDLRDGNMLVPIISIKTLAGKLKGYTEGVVISINVVLPNDFGPVGKMLPGKNCLRLGENNHQKTASESEPTPAYNSTIRQLASSTDMDHLIEQATRDCEAFADVCLLGDSWLRQRGFASHVAQGGFGLTEWSHMCALLLNSGGHKGNPLFSGRYSCVQLFKAMLQVLATRDLRDPLVLRNQGIGLAKGDFPVLFDGHCGFNVLLNMTRWSYDLLRHHAELSLTAVNARSQNNFEPTFITKVADPHLQYHEIYTIAIPTHSSLETETTSYDLSKLYDVLKKGFDDRVSTISLRTPPQTPWKLTAADSKTLKHSQTLDVCLLVNPDTVNRSIDHGPTAEQQEEAREFRRFWGEKSELRRFRDGSITETLVWSTDKSVTLQILQYLLAYHFKLLPSSIISRSPDLNAEFLLSAAPLSVEDAFKLISNKYQELSSKLHQIEGLPLPIRSVSPIGQATRSTAMSHPLDPKTSAPIEIVIQFDSSARWPDNLLAIQHTKVAFLAKISDLVTESDPAITCRIGLEKTNEPNQSYNNTSFLDIIYPSPAAALSPMVFRFRIHHEREVHLLQNLTSDRSTIPQVRETVSKALLDHKRTFVASPAHTSALRNLITHFQPLSPTIRLLKYWFASHSLSNHVPDPILEIVAAHIFLKPYPWSLPGNAKTAFLRTLHFFAHWDWSTTPLIVDLSLSEDMTSAQVTELETRYQAWRKLDPNMNTMAWFVGTNVDSTGTIWTQGSNPPRVIAGRVSVLAKAACELVKTKGIDMEEDDWKSLFISPISDFDFVLHLKSSVVRGGKRGGRKNGETKFKNLQIQDALDVDGIGHDAVSLYLADLEHSFANSVMFFHGEHGKYIAGLWKPNVTGMKTWRVRLGYSTVPHSTQKEKGDVGVEEFAQLNKEGILAEMAQLGNDVIDTISIKQ